MASFWESFGGQHPMKFYTFTPEVRYHFKEKYNGCYVGGYTVPDISKIQKWNYWNTNLYEDGFGYRLDVTVGYIFTITEKINLDAFFGGEWHQRFYKGYYNDGTPGSKIGTKAVNGSRTEEV